MERLFGLVRSNHRINGETTWNSIIREFNANGYSITNVKPGLSMDVITPESKILNADEYLDKCGCKPLSLQLLHTSKTIQRLCPGSEGNFLVTIVDREIKGYRKTNGDPSWMAPH